MNYHKINTSSSLIAKAGALLAGCFLAAGSLSAQIIVNTDFSLEGATFESLGWTTSYTDTTAVARWEIKSVSQLGNQRVASFTQGNAAPKTNASLIKSFDTVDFSQQELKLSFDAGWIWGGMNYAAAGFRVALLDDDGNGYVFVNRRNNTTNYAAGWAVVRAGDDLGAVALNGVSVGFDTRQVAISSDAAQGFQEFVITRSVDGDWSFGGAHWLQDLVFNDGTNSSFSQIVFFQNSGFDNSIQYVINNVKLESVIPEPSTVALLGAAAAGLFAVVVRRRRKA